MNSIDERIDIWKGVFEWAHGSGKFEEALRANNKLYKSAFEGYLKTLRGARKATTVRRAASNYEKAIYYLGLMNTTIHERDVLFDQQNTREGQ
jgi:hypothetical protein